MPFPLLILGALALAGGGAYLAFSGSRGEPSKGATSSPASSPLTAAGPADKPKPSKKKTFRAASGKLPAGGNGSKKQTLPPAARYALMRDYAAVAASFEAEYDKSKDKDGWGGFVDKAGAVANVGGAVLTLGMAGDITDVKEFSADLKQQFGGGRAGAWKAHEAAAARMVSLAQVPPDVVTRAVHHGEEYTWSRYLVLVPGYGLVGT